MDVVLRQVESPQRVEIWPRRRHLVQDCHAAAFRSGASGNVTSLVVKKADSPRRTPQYKPVKPSDRSTTRSPARQRSCLRISIAAPRGPILPHSNSGGMRGKATWSACAHAASATSRAIQLAVRRQNISDTPRGHVSCACTAEGGAWDMQAEAGGGARDPGRDDGAHDAVPIATELWDPRPIADDVWRRIGVDPSTLSSDIAGFQHLDQFKRCGGVDFHGYAIDVWSQIHTIEDFRHHKPPFAVVPVCVSDRHGLRHRPQTGQADTHSHLIFPATQGSCSIEVLRSRSGPTAACRIMEVAAVLVPLLPR